MEQEKTIKTVSFFEGSYMFKQVSTRLNVSQDYLEMILAKQYEYRPTQEDLWAEVKDGEIVQRFSFTYGQGLSKIELK
jgi:hypothetical protein